MFEREVAVQQGRVVGLSKRSAERLAECYKDASCAHCRRGIVGEDIAHRGAFILHPNCVAAFDREHQTDRTRATRAVSRTSPAPTAAMRRRQQAREEINALKRQLSARQRIDRVRAEASRVDEELYRLRVASINARVARLGLAS